MALLSFPRTVLSLKQSTEPTQVQSNAEDDRDYPLANAFHYWSMDALRIGSWSILYRALLKEDIRRDIEYGERNDITSLGALKFNDLDANVLLNKEARQRRWREIVERRRFGLVRNVYWMSSGYGVSPTRASWVLVALWFVFTVFYFWLVESSPFWVYSASDIGQRIDYARQAMVYSVSALVRLNPRPQSEHLDWFQTLVTIEGILGPLQIALLALAIRRKVMR